ncbi:MAG: hypothetical protein RR304_08315 [Bacteroides sp.]
MAFKATNKKTQNNEKSSLPQERVNGPRLLPGRERLPRWDFRLVRSNGSRMLKKAISRAIDAGADIRQALSNGWWVKGK